MIIEERVARLESDVGHIRTDIAEMKTDIRRIDGKVDAVKDSVTALEIKMLDGFADINGRMQSGFAAVDGKFAAVDGKFAAVDGKFAELEKKMLAGFAEMKVGRVWDRVWMLMIAAGLLGIIARVFKWI